MGDIRHIDILKMTAKQATSFSSIKLIFHLRIQEEYFFFKKTCNIPMMVFITLGSSTTLEASLSDMREENMAVLCCYRCIVTCGEVIGLKRGSKKPPQTLVYCPVFL